MSLPMRIDNGYSRRRLTPSAIDEVSRPAFSFITEATFVGETEPHRHGKGAAALRDERRADDEGGRRCLDGAAELRRWIPGGTSHSGACSAAISRSATSMSTRN